MVLPPIHREILVNAVPERAFAVFTEDIGLWWPVGDHSVHGEGATVAFADGAIVETSASGVRSTWGEITRWEPGVALAMTWHPGKDHTDASSVTITFTPLGAQTLVVLEHSGWERFADPIEAREEYGHGWPTVLARYGSAVGEATPEAAGERSATWAALLHTPGPSAPAAGPLQHDGRFAQHVAFLERMAAKGYLVAAGPLADEDGAGMTILRLPGEDRMAEVAALATQDDRSVADGLLSVAVRPWQVVISTT